MINKEQRVGIFVDVQNLYYSARYLYNSKVDFKEILNLALRGRRLVRAIAYTISADMKDEVSFFKALETIGFEVKSKDLQVFHTGGKKGDWDVGIAIDSIEIAPRLDVIVIVSGDGDYVPLVEHLRRVHGCKVEAMSFGKSSSLSLKNALDEFLDLDKSPRFLINPQDYHNKQHKKGFLQKILPRKEEIKLTPIQQAILEDKPIISENKEEILEKLEEIKIKTKEEKNKKIKKKTIKRKKK